MDSDTRGRLERDTDTIPLSADTIVVLAAPHSAVLEKPRNTADQYGMLVDYNGSMVQVITAVTIGALVSIPDCLCDAS